MSDDSPDDFDPEAAERAISEFIDSAEALPGPSVGEFAGLVADIMGEAWDRVEGLMTGQRHNKVLGGAAAAQSAGPAGDAR